MQTGSPEKGELKVVSAEFGPIAILDGHKQRNRTTAIQRVVRQWLIAKYGMSYKKVKHDVLKQMMMSIINMDDLLDLGVQCKHVAKEYAIGFNTVVKTAKLAAGLFTFID